MASQGVNNRIAESVLADLLNSASPDDPQHLAEHLVREAYDVEFKARGDGGERIVLTFQLDKAETKSVIEPAEPVPPNTGRH